MKYRGIYNIFVTESVRTIVSDESVCVILDSIATGLIIFTVAVWEKEEITMEGAALSSLIINDAYLS